MRPLAAALAGLILAACGGPVAKPLKAPVPAGPGIVIKAEPVPLNPADPKQDRVGDLVYAGGLRLTSGQTSRLHGLSDLDVQPDGSLIAVGDEGDLLRAKVVLDAQGRLTGITDARLTALTGLDGKPLQGKDDADSEGLALLPNGDLLISFERHDRIWLYPADGGPPRAVPSPDVKFPYNQGMEALAPDPLLGPDAYFAGGETTGRTWSCTLTTPCAEGPTVPLAMGFGLVAARRLPEGRTAWLLRAFNPVTRSVIDLRITDQAGRVVDQQELRGPLTVDNFEGLAAVPAPSASKGDGTIRFYLISDDNFSSSQRTLLLAFDWKPPAPR
ncbi:esterase-like activity of phytase family protein [Phenylobacterium sp.]|uniref:esterase-like activity of phytase family protein n=1 Tax=Phenylobacterium sp. TaxID=1871053 RepID=UPI002E352F62|nr:esterase-like activity of phytase family protein [Phenylobacterium sp.]HEX4710567.1 esterase-like activity of phytase family protein [Phenylobacterium sp.]